MDWEVIRKEYESTDITMKDLADKHGVKSSTLRSRKNREKWQRNEENNVATKKTTQRKSVATRKAIREIEGNTKLSDKQKNFCLFYLKYFNATKAYQKAYQVSYEVANSHGYKLLSNVVIKEELSRLKEAQRTDLYIESLDIKKQWVKQAFADVNDFIEYGYVLEDRVDEWGAPLFDENGEPIKEKRSKINFRNMEDVDGTLIKEIRMGKDGPVVQLYDKQKAMQELLKLMDHGGNTNGGVIFLDSKEEMEKYLRERGETDGD